MVLTVVTANVVVVTLGALQWLCYVTYTQSMYLHFNKFCYVNSTFLCELEPTWRVVIVIRNSVHTHTHTLSHSLSLSLSLFLSLSLSLGCTHTALPSCTKYHCPLSNHYSTLAAQVGLGTDQTHLLLSLIIPTTSL